MIQNVMKKAGCLAAVLLLGLLAAAYPLAGELPVAKAEDSPDIYTLTLQGSPAGGGTVTGEGEFEAGEAVPITAEAKDGYRFVEWTEDGAFLSEQAVLEYQMPPHNVTLVAHFAAEFYLMVAGTQPGEIGLVEGQRGETVQVPVNLSSDGTVAGVQFELVYDQELLIYESISQGALTSPDFTVEAHQFTPGRIRVLIVCPEGGLLIPGGTGSVAELSFRVRDDAHPGQESPLELDAVILADDTTPVPAPLEPVELGQGRLEVLPPDTRLLALAVDPAGGGTVQGDGEYNPGTEVPLEAHPATGYRFLHWTLNGEVISEDPFFNFTMPEEDVILTAHFEVIEGTGSITHVVLEVGEDRVIFAIGTYGSALAAGPGNKHYDYMTSEGALTVRAVSSGDKFIGIGAYGTAFAQAGETAGAIAAAPALDWETIGTYLVFGGFDEDDEPILTPYLP